MINKGTTELRFWVDADNNEVDPSTPNAKEVIVPPGGEITVKLSAEKKNFLQRTGHLEKDTGDGDAERRVS